jgi:hypothetical protein
MVKTISTQEEYELKVDLERKIVYEEFKGIFTKEAVAKMKNDYKTKILPLFKGSKWAKYCDMRNYKLSGSQDELGEFVQYCTDNGMAHASIIVASAVVKMQMNRVGKSVGVTPVAFTDEKEGEDYLKTSGY